MPTTVCRCNHHNLPPSEADPNERPQKVQAVPRRSTRIPAKSRNLQNYWTSSLVLQSRGVAGSLSTLRLLLRSVTSSFHKQWRNMCFPRDMILIASISVIMYRCNFIRTLINTHLVFVLINFQIVLTGQQISFTEIPHHSTVRVGKIFWL